jgi:integrase
VATIRKRDTQKGVVWTAEIKRRGQPRESKTFSRRTDATTWARRRETEISENRANPGAIARRHTVANLLRRYRDEVLPHKRASTSFTQSRQLIWWEGQIGHMFLADVLPATVSASMEKLRQAGKANATRVRYLAVLSHAFNTAVKDWGMCLSNPCEKVRKPKEPRGRARFLSDDERSILLNAAHGCRNAAVPLIIQLALCTGARQGEIRNLRWPEVDLTREQVTFLDTKNDDRRTVPLVEPALSAMREYARTHRRVDTTLVFPSPNGHKPLVINKTWDRLMQRAGLDDFRFHDLRHSCASYLAQNGASLAEISEILGHRSLQMVKRYAHLRPEHLRNSLQRMSREVLQS